MADPVEKKEQSVNEQSVNEQSVKKKEHFKEVKKKANANEKATVVKKVVEKKPIGKCCSCVKTGTCRRCSCAVKHVACTCCVPMKYN